jgi:hypothetical protein
VRLAFRSVRSCGCTAGPRWAREARRLDQRQPGPHPGREPAGSAADRSRTGRRQPRRVVFPGVKERVLVIVHGGSVAGQAGGPRRVLVASSSAPDCPLVRARGAELSRGGGLIKACPASCPPKGSSVSPLGAAIRGELGGLYARRARRKPELDPNYRPILGRPSRAREPRRDPDGSQPRRNSAAQSLGNSRHNSMRSRRRRAR